MVAGTGTYVCIYECRNVCMYVYVHTLLHRYLLRAQQLPHSISGAMQFVAPKLLGVVNVLHLQQDRLENELLRELENGRLFRLLSKLGVINERPELVCAI